MQDLKTKHELARAALGQTFVASAPVALLSIGHPAEETYRTDRRPLADLVRHEAF